MLGAIAGDIAGSRFEGDRHPPADFALFAPGCGFTDDTVCCLAVADAILSGADFAGTLRAFVRRHPDAGYGGMFAGWARDEGAGPYGSWGNGAPMRVAAVGWLVASEAEADRLAAAQAAVSHDHSSAVAGAQAVARAILALRLGAETDAVGDRIAAAFGYDLDPAVALAPGPVGISAQATVPPALAAALTCDSWEAAVRRVIALGGDTDTVACIAGAVAEARHGLPDGIAATARGYLSADLRCVLERVEAARAGG